MILGKGRGLHADVPEGLVYVDHASPYYGTARLGKREGFERALEKLHFRMDDGELLIRGTPRSRYAPNTLREHSCRRRQSNR